MGDPFARMHARLFSHLGAQALLRGTDSCSAEVTHGVAIVGEFADQITYRTVVSINYPGVAKPNVGNTVTIVGGATYTLDKAMGDDGYSSKWTVF